MISTLCNGHKPHLSLLLLFLLLLLVLLRLTEHFLALLPSPVASFSFLSIWQRRLPLESRHHHHRWSERLEIVHKQRKNIRLQQIQITLR